jgi:hypothetical protein
MILDSGATMLVVSKGYLEQRGLAKGIVRGDRHEVTTADGVVITEEKLVVDLCLPCGPEKHSFRAEAVVLPTKHEIPFLFPMRFLEEWGMVVNFKTGETEWETDQGPRKLKWELSGERGSRSLISPVEVFTVVQRKKSACHWSGGQGKAFVAASAGEAQRESGNGRSPGWPRGLQRK